MKIHVFAARRGFKGREHSQDLLVGAQMEAANLVGQIKHKNKEDI